MFNDSIIGTGLLSAPDVNSANNYQPGKKACCGIPTRVHPHLPGLTINQYTTWLAVQYTTWLAEDGPRSGSHSRLFSGLLVIGTVNTVGALNDPVSIYKVFNSQTKQDNGKETCINRLHLPSQSQKNSRRSWLEILGNQLIVCSHTLGILTATSVYRPK